MPFVENRNVALYYEVMGEPHWPVVVLAHGRGGNTAVWFQQVPAFRQRYRVLVFDHRGFGRSRCTAADYDMAHFASDLAAILDHAGIAQAALVCQSMGGWTGLRLAVEQPARVAALVLANSIAGLATPAADAAIRATRQRLAAAGIAAAALDPGFAAREPGLAWLYSQIAGQNQVTAAGWHSLSPAETAPAEAAGIRVPVLLLTAAHDSIFPAAAVREVARLIPGATLTSLPGAGHSAYFEAPTAWNAAVLDFLAATWR